MTHKKREDGFETAKVALKTFKEEQQARLDKGEVNLKNEKPLHFLPNGYRQLTVVRQAKLNNKKNCYPETSEIRSRIDLEALFDGDNS